MKLTIDHNSQTPLHKQVEKLLRELIEKPEYKDGKLLPKEVDLSEQLNISRNTLRQSINTLVSEGLLTRKKGVGTRVEKKKIFSGASNWLSFSEEMKILGIEIHNFELQIIRHEVSSEVAAFFNIKAGIKVMRLERLRGKKEFPFVYFISEFSPEIPISASENFNRPLYEILEADYGIIAETSKEEINAAAADNFIASKLEIKPGDPILIRKRYVYDIHNNPIEYNIGCYRADSFTYTLESKRIF
ncbi:MAG: GntR family transcriptional regulator [Tannerellaceae bacterium]|jgi:GntR family transcriptional regulator|nr:GntR family transcriptional regulator [Tannerellaceae bacterium]